MSERRRAAGVLLFSALRRRVFRFYRRPGWRLLQRLLPTVRADW